MPKRHLLFIGIFAASIGMGCESRPTNPGREVMQNPPQEVSMGRFQSVSFSINGQDLSSGVVELRQNEEISVEGRLPRIEKSGDTQGGMLIVRFRPTGTAESSWKELNSDREIVGGINAFSEKLAAAKSLELEPGEHEIRCYSLFTSPTSEKPEYVLLAKGKAVIEVRPPVP